MTDDEIVNFGIKECDCMQQKVQGKTVKITYNNYIQVMFEVFMAVTKKNAVFWDVTPCGSCKNRCFGGI
jgi:uncharacterized protein with PIN domain